MHVNLVLCCVHNKRWLCNSMYLSLSVYFTAITVGYSQTAVNVSESDEVAQLTVAITMPPEDVPVETSFSLLVNTVTGLLALECEFGLWSVNFGLCMYTLVRQSLIIVYT